MTLPEIKELIELLKESGVAELEVQRGENRVRISRGATAAEVAAHFSAAGAAPAPVAAPAEASAAASAPAAPAADETLVAVKSPIVGTFYESPTPGSSAFVKVGDQVTKGQVLCIIESMKLMNEIECEIAGTIVSKLVENGKAVEYGEALFTIRPR